MTIFIEFNCDGVRGIDTNWNIVKNDRNQKVEKNLPVENVKTFKRIKGV